MHAHADLIVRQIQAEKRADAARQRLARSVRAAQGGAPLLPWRAFRRLRRSAQPPTARTRPGAQPTSHAWGA